MARIRRRLRGLEAAARTHARGRRRTGRGQGGGQPAAPRPAAARAKLSYKEQRELEALPGRIEALEAEQKTLFERLASASLYTEAPQQVAALQARHDEIEAELMAALERWETLAAR